MTSKVVILQALLLCYTSVCWGYSCSPAGEDGSSRCGIALDGSNLSEAVEKIMAKVRLVLPKADNVNGEGCKSKCFGGEGSANGGSMNASAKIDHAINNIKELVRKLEESNNQAAKKENARKAVGSFTEDRDWPKLRKALESSLEPGHPALEQARAVDWPDGKDALMDVVYSGHVDLLQELLDLGLDANLPWGPNNSTMMHAAASAGRKDVAEVLFSRGAVIDYRADFRVTPLLRAATSGQPGMVQWLLDHGADVFVTDTRGWTALHSAARANDLESVKVLVAGGVLREALNEKGNTARDEASNLGFKDIVDFLEPEDPFNNEVDAA